MGNCGCNYDKGGIDASLLFFFLILVLLFCMPSVFGCGGDTCGSC
ncbi:hypothetical protein [Aminipila terrae]|nr:hypothetical protein [Aminipila terrae]